MGFMIGSNGLDNCKIGANQVDKIYLGSSEIWSANNLPNWVPTDWKSHIPTDLPTGTSSVVFAIRYNNYICVFKVVAKTLQTINCVGTDTRYTVIENPLHNSYSAYSKMIYRLDGTFNRETGNHNFLQYLNTLESVDNAGGLTGDNAVLLEVSGGFVWWSRSVIGIDDYT